MWDGFLDLRTKALSPRELEILKALERKLVSSMASPDCASFLSSLRALGFTPLCNAAAALACSRGASCVLERAQQLLAAMSARASDIEAAMELDDANEAVKQTQHVLKRQRLRRGRVANGANDIRNMLRFSKQRLCAHAERLTSTAKSLQEISTAIVSCEMCVSAYLFVGRCIELSQGQHPCFKICVACVVLILSRDLPISVCAQVSQQEPAAGGCWH